MQSCCLFLFHSLLTFQLLSAKNGLRVRQKASSDEAHPHSQFLLDQFIVAIP
jgi:hypothetical protein